jgi:hypothetical protein
MRTPSITILSLILLLLSPLTARAQLDFCHAELPDGPLPRYILVLPDGSGPPLVEGRIDGGEIHSAVITLWVIDGNGEPIEHYPAADVWLVTSCDEASFCSYTHPDGSTDENGMTTFSGPFNAGGHMPPGCVIQVVIAGIELPEPGLELRMLGPDITGDLVVNLPDIVLFTQAISTYDWSSDFNRDGTVDLTDIVVMAQALGAECP